MADIVLAVMAHPDDEVLGCGATLARHAARGDTVHVLFLADGETARGQDYQPKTFAEAIAARHKAAEAAAKVLDLQPPRFLDLPDNRLDGMHLLDLAKAVEAVLAEVKPSIIYTHHSGDLNVDHRRTREAVLTACRPLPGRPVRRIYGCEVLSSTEFGDSSSGTFTPRRFVNVAAQLEAKLAALACYDREMAPFPHPRSPEAVRALAAWRGSASGLLAAEAFDIIREIEQ